MDQAGIIRDLLIWLEGHLDQPLSLDNVAAKAGYSKWHLQRMFKDVTGHAIGAYIRARRLSKSAVALRLTARPILDIALQYRFDSQQTFTRAFKKQFAQTPALYRRSPEWSAFGIRPPLRLGEFTMPEHKFVTLEDTPLIGVTQSYSCSLEQISDFRHEMRYQFWHDFLGNAPTIPPVLYGLNETRPSQDKDDEQEVFYTTALAQDQLKRKDIKDTAGASDAKDYLSVLKLSYAVFQLLQLLYDLLRPSVEKIRALCWAHTLFGALKKNGFQFCLQGPYIFSQSLRCDIKASGSPADAFFLIDGLKTFQIFCVHVFACLFSRDTPIV